MSTKRLLDLDEVRERAMRAYFRRRGSWAAQPADGGEMVEHDGLLYVRLANIGGVLAVYRVRGDGKLKWLKRWPRELG